MTLLAGMSFLWYPSHVSYWEKSNRYYSGTIWNRKFYEGLSRYNSEGLSRFFFLIKLTSSLYKKKNFEDTENYIARRTSLAIDLRKLSVRRAMVWQVLRNRMPVMLRLSNPQQLWWQYFIRAVQFSAPRWVFSKADRRPGSNFVY